jgi:hypothetical protein
MKTPRFFSVLIILISIAACSGPTNSDDNTNENVETPEIETPEEETTDNQETSPKDISTLSCDEFVEEYEKFADEYIEMVHKYMKSPMNTTVSNSYMKFTEKYALWFQSIPSVAIKCSENESFEEDMKSISERIEAEVEKYKEK